MNDVMRSRIKLLRKKKRMTQQEVADCLGICRTNYNAYELGNVVPTSEKIMRLAELFDVSIDYLMGLSNDFDIVYPLRNTPDLSEQLNDILDELTDDSIAIRYKDKLLTKEQKADVIPLIKSSIRMLGLTTESAIKMVKLIEQNHHKK